MKKLKLRSISSLNKNQKMRILTLFIVLIIVSCTPKVAQISNRADNPLSTFYLPEKEFLFFENGAWVKGTPDEVTDPANNKPFFTAMYTSINYPAKARESGTQGAVLIDITQDETGQIIDANIRRDLHNGCGEAALKALLHASTKAKLQPIYKDGQPQKVKYFMPVNFRLE